MTSEHTTEATERTPSLALRAVLQAGLGLLLTAAMLPLVYLAGQWRDAVALRLHSAALDPVITLLVFAIGGLFAARLSSTLAHKPWDGLGACAVAGAVGAWQLWGLHHGPDAVGIALWPLGLALGCVVTALVIQRLRRGRPSPDTKTPSP